MIKIRLLALLLFSAYTTCLEVGEECLRDYDNAQGVCMLHHQCRSVRDDYYKGIPLTYCSETAGVSVCCPDSSKRRVSGIKCSEYGRMWKKQTLVAGTILSDSKGTPHAITSHTCNPSTPLIFGGVKAEPGEFPHMAAIGWRRTRGVSFHCGGSLISDRYVLSAAHCDKEIDRAWPSFVRLGDQNLKNRDDNLQEVDINIETFIKHPEYASRTQKNDIALIKLEKVVTFSYTISPACLWQTSSVNYTKLIAAGWGATDELAASTTDELMKVELDRIDNNRCNSLLLSTETITLERRVDDSQICAGLEVGGRDTCGGDSGGPLHLVIKDLNPCLFHVVGITSFGSVICGAPLAPAVYTRISYFLDWIENIVWG